MYRAVSRRPPIPEIRFRHRTKSFEICVEQSNHWTCLFLRTRDILCKNYFHYHAPCASSFYSFDQTEKGLESGKGPRILSECLRKSVLSGIVWNIGQSRTCKFFLQIFNFIVYNFPSDIRQKNTTAAVSTELSVTWRCGRRTQYT
jgi:hypothetical protein